MCMIKWKVKDAGACSLMGTEAEEIRNKYKYNTDDKDKSSDKDFKDSKNKDETKKDNSKKDIENPENEDE